MPEVKQTNSGKPGVHHEGFLRGEVVHDAQLGQPRVARNRGDRERVTPAQDVESRVKNPWFVALPQTHHP